MGPRTPGCFSDWWYGGGGAFQLLPAPVVQRINEMVALPLIAIFTVATFAGHRC